MAASPRPRLRWVLVWSTAAAGLAGVPAEAAAQSGAKHPGGQLGLWIEEARTSPFHDLMMSGNLAKPAAESAVDEGADVRATVRPPTTPLSESPDNAASFEKVFGYTLVAAFVPMAAAMTIASGFNIVSVFGGWALTLVSVPIAATAAGTTRVPETVVGAVLGFVAGAVVGGAFAWGLGDLWYSPVYAATMAGVTAAIAPR
ncbi:MAG: hypothetical protein F4X60_00675 [Gemmatimonadetes bacterium]|nr:hypothetical protein [Gemmatimonadota bacterium]MYB97058.1 hypothetical protein [Gemmatimonadota bacterium]